MRTITFPFTYSAYGTIRKSVQKSIRIVEEFTFSPRRIETDDVDTLLDVIVDGERYVAPVVDGSIYLPVLLAATQPDRHLDVERIAERARGTIETQWIGDALWRQDDPLLKQGDFSSKLDHAHTYENIRLEQVREILPSNRDEKLSAAARRADCLIDYEGRVYSCLREPVLLGGPGEWIWATTLPEPSVHQRGKMISGQFAPKLESQITYANNFGISGDLAKVRWTYDDQTQLLESAGLQISQIFEKWSMSLGVTTETMKTLHVRGQMLEALARAGEAVDVEWALSLIRDTSAYLEVHGLPERSAYREQGLRELTSILELRQELLRKPDALDLDALSSLRV